MKATDLAFKPGQTLTCIVSKLPRNQDTRDTIARLMRLDPASKKALRTAQRMRRQRMVIYNRGNRDWVKRESTAKVVRVEKGANWTFEYNYGLAGDVAKVQAYVEISAK
jgi:hypothetical protein